MKFFYYQLAKALSESQKNASLLTEYHELYELQRKRLEKLVETLTEEREVWSNAAYSIAMKVDLKKILFLTYMKKINQLS